MSKSSARSAASKSKEDKPKGLLSVLFGHGRGMSEFDDGPDYQSDDQSDAQAEKQAQEEQQARQEAERIDEQAQLDIAKAAAQANEFVDAHQQAVQAQQQAQAHQEEQARAAINARENAKAAAAQKAAAQLQQEQELQNQIDQSEGDVTNYLAHAALLGMAPQVQNKPSQEMSPQETPSHETPKRHGQMKRRTRPNAANLAYQEMANSMRAAGVQGLDGRLTAHGQEIHSYQDRDRLRDSFETIGTARELVDDVNDVKNQTPNAWENSLKPFDRSVRNFDIKDGLGGNTDKVLMGYDILKIATEKDKSWTDKLGDSVERFLSEADDIALSGLAGAGAGLATTVMSGGVATPASPIVGAAAAMTAGDLYNDTWLDRKIDQDAKNIGNFMRNGAKKVDGLIGKYWTQKTKGRSVPQRYVNSFYR